jgi:hypothetical protein
LQKIVKLIHPLLETLELIHQHTEHSDNQEPSDANHDAADGLCRIDSSRDELQETMSSSFVTVVTAVPLATVFVGVVQQQQLEGPPTTAPPPELRTTWQFSSRNALPARSPSILS